MDGVLVIGNQSRSGVNCESIMFIMTPIKDCQVDRKLLWETDECRNTNVHSLKVNQAQVTMACSYAVLIGSHFMEIYSTK
jgi:hypothetical protein